MLKGVRIPALNATLVAMTDQPTILLVEDNEISCGAISQVLKWEGYRVLTAPHGAHALKLLRRGERPCLILLDLMMPVMNGWELHAHLRADPELSEIPVVVMTGIGDADREARALNAWAVLPKPFELDSLVALLSQAGRAAA
jgi:CheY-like chemotaxis protein